MSYDPTPIFDALYSKCAKLGIPKAGIGEPFDPPASVSAFVMWDGATVNEIHGTKASGYVRFTIRFYSRAIEQPTDMPEKAIAKLTLLLMDDLSGDSDLGDPHLTDADTRNVEVMQLAAQAGFQSIGEGPRIMYRVSDLVVNVRVNNMLDLG